MELNQGNYIILWDKDYMIIKRKGLETERKP